MPRRKRTPEEIARKTNLLKSQVKKKKVKNNQFNIVH